LKKFWLFDWYRHQILVWPIAALRNELSANQKAVFSVTCNAETGFKPRLRVWFNANPVSAFDPTLIYLAKSPFIRALILVNQDKRSCTSQTTKTLSSFTVGSFVLWSWILLANNRFCEKVYAPHAATLVFTRENRGEAREIRHFYFCNIWPPSLFAFLTWRGMWKMASHIGRRTTRSTACSFVWKWSGGCSERERSAGGKILVRQSYFMTLRPVGRLVGQSQLLMLPSFTRKNRPWTG